MKVLSFLTGHFEIVTIPLLVENQKIPINVMQYAIGVDYMAKHFWVSSSPMREV